MEELVKGSQEAEQNALQNFQENGSCREIKKINNIRAKAYKKCRHDNINCSSNESDSHSSLSSDSD